MLKIGLKISDEMALQVIGLFKTLAFRCIMRTNTETLNSAWLMLILVGTMIVHVVCEMPSESSKRNYCNINIKHYEISNHQYSLKLIKYCNQSVTVWEII